ncbi:MAG: helix-turn-helix transcriptional regulator [Kofleriaceae bacterium]|nr:helix-turn-helix transcriptional regulator [Kofleriaceae bacterium]
MVERTTVLETPALHVELLRCALGRGPTEETYTTRRQVMFPLSGTFRWHVGRSVMLCDPNQVMFVETNEASFDTATQPGIVTCLLATVSDATARRLWRTATAFRKRTAIASARLQARYAWFASAAQNDALWEQHALELVASATDAAIGAAPAPAPAAAIRLATRAKDLLGDRGRLLGLGELAEKLDVSPAYLTDAFRRAAGIPIVRYQLRLRLMRAMRELPHASDLTALALELGFSSHSHFSTAFRVATGLTPSQYRETARRGDAIERIRKRSRVASR